MRGGGWGLTLASAVLVTGCSAVGGGGGGPQDPPKPVDFPTAFAQVSQDVTNRVTAATTAADPAGACRELAGQPLTDWVSALSGAPDTLAGVVNGYLVRVQLAVYKCQDRVGTATDLPDIATRADTVRAALVQASATPSPSASRSVLPSAPRAALAALRMLCRTGLSAIGSITAADETGFAFNRTVSSLVRAGGTADSYRQADAKLRDLKPCNAAQATYLQGNIEFNGWLAAEAACKEAFYYDAKTLGDVFGPWLACIGPVNTAIVASSKKTGNLEVLKATCTPGYQPPPLGPSQGLLAAQVTAVANQIRQAFDAVHDLKEAAELLEHGLKVLTAREITPGDLAALVTKIQLKLGDLLIDATAEGVRERLRAINFPAITKPLPAAPAKMTITVTETGPGLDLATGTHSVTFKN